MAGSRNYAKGLARREEILRVALDLVAQRGYGSATIRELAEAVGLSKTGLLHHFGTKEALFTEILRRRDLEATGSPAGGDVRQAAEGLGRRMGANSSIAGLVQLYVSFLGEATDPQHVAHGYFRGRYADVRGQLVTLISTMQAEGEVDEQVDPATCATLLNAVLEGLQAQWLFDPTIDMEAHVARFFDLMRPARPGAPDLTAGAELS